MVITAHQWHSPCALALAARSLWRQRAPLTQQKPGARLCRLWLDLMNGAITEAIRDTQRQAEGNRGHQRSSEGHQGPSVAIRGTRLAQLELQLLVRQLGHTRARGRASPALDTAR